MSILKFKTVDEVLIIIYSFIYLILNKVISRANKSSYGLAAGIVTKDLENALNISSRLKAGMGL